jgi:WD40 repeat protein
MGLSLDGSKIVTGSEDRTLKVWDGETGQHLLTLKGHNDHVRCVMFSPDGKRLLSCGDDCTLKLWDTENRK